MNYDIVIAGAGPAGLSFTRLLADTGLKIALIEKQSRAALESPEFDGRDIALTHLSVRLLREIGVWDRLDADEKPPIREARVIDGTSPISLDFDVAREDVDALGYIVSNHNIRRALMAEVETLSGVELITDTAVTGVSASEGSTAITLSDDRVLSAGLFVSADSRFSETRRMIGIAAEMFDFGRICIVCRVEHDDPHDGVAFECFHYGSTLAVLPLYDNVSSVVVTAPMSQRDARMSMPEDEFALDVQRRFANRYGAMRLISERFAYPLVGVHAKKFCATRCALIGDAAVGMHPVTAHGYNLGLSGADLLAREIRTAVANNRDIGSPDLLRRYERKHLRSTRLIYRGTNEIVKLFTDDRAAARLARKIVLRLASRILPIKSVIRNKLTERENRTALSHGRLSTVFRILP
ncbi:MAG: 5-demethoxyubiquinol-8 5-hydroxylase UbiM [Woeseiaceae bacterium]